MKYQVTNVIKGESSFTKQFDIVIVVYFYV